MSTLIVVDNEKHRKNEAYYKSLTDGCEVYYTEYEDGWIRKVRNYKFIGSFLYHVLMWLKSYRYAAQIFKEEYENVVCLNPLVGIFLGVKNKNKKLRLTLSGFLFEEKKNKLYYALRKKLVQKMLKNTETVVVYSSQEIRYYAKIFPEFKDKFVFTQFGLDYDHTENYSGKLPDKFIFSGGGSNRDYGTLVSTVEMNHLTIPCVIATQPWRVPKHSEKVIVLSDVVVETFGHVMSKSQLLVLSLKDVELSAGHMVMLQALQLGIPILVNDIPAVRDYVDEDIVTFYPSGNIEILNKSIVDLIENKDSTELQTRLEKGRELYQSEYTSKALMKRLVEIANV